MHFIQKRLEVLAKNYGNVIKFNSIRHIIKDHGVNGETDSSMADDADIARIQYVIDNYDTMELLEDKSKEYRDKNQKPAPMVRISKRVNGSYYVVEAVPDTKRHELPIVSAYKNKAVEQRTVDVQAPTSNVRNASPDTTLSNNNISQSGNVVKEGDAPISNTSATGDNMSAQEASAQNAPRSARRSATPQSQGGVSQSSTDIASSYGARGKAAFEEIMAENNWTPEQTKRRFQSAYELGLTEAPRRKVRLIDAIQETAYNAGRQDAILSMKKEKTKGIAIWGKNGGLVENDYTKRLDNRTFDTLNKIGRATGTKIIFENIPIEENSDGYYRDSDGTIHIDINTDKPIMTVVKHELTHRLQTLAPREYRAFRNYAVSVMNGNTPYGHTATEAQRLDYLAKSDGQINLNTEEAMDELASNFTERILTDEKALNDFVNHITSSAENMTMGQKFFQVVREFIDKVKAVFNGDRSKMDAAAQKEFGATISQLEKAERLWKNAYAAAAKRAQKSGTTQNTLENNSKEGYNGDIKYALKNSRKAQRGRSIEIETMENNRFERLRQFHDDLPSEWFAYTDKYFYVYSNHSYMDYTILLKVSLTSRNKNDIDVFMEEIEDGINGSTKIFDYWIKNFRRGKGRYTWNPISTSSKKATGRLDGVDVRPSRSDNSGNFKESSRDSDVKHSLKEKNWRTDLNKSQYEILKRKIKHDAQTSENSITDTANWYSGSIEGVDVFAIYSTQDISDPTILYERKGEQGKAELNALRRILEVIEHGESVIGKQGNIDRLLSGNWLQEKHNLANNNDRPRGRGGDIGYASVLQGKSSQFIGSKAFRNVIRNLFEIQERTGELNEGKRHSLKEKKVAEVKGNGIKQNRESFENDRRHNKVQTQESTGSFQKRDAEGLHQFGQTRQKNSGSVETRTIENVVDTDDFQQLARSVGNELSSTMLDELLEKYSDNEMTDAYDFSEVVAYDMLSDVGNELRTLFADSIDEYFNDNTSADVDATGRTIDKGIIDKLSKSVVRNQKGQLILLYHGTDKVHSTLKAGDIGIHFGSYNQAAKRAQKSGTSQNTLENNSKEGYNGDIKHALKNWRTDLNKSQYEILKRKIKHDAQTSENSITDTANWYSGSIEGVDVFAIYSTQDISDPTILYERKGEQGKAELDTLMDLLEVYENAENTNKKSSYVSWVSGSGWLQEVNGHKDNLGNMGGGQNNQNAGVLQRQSQRNGSRAFWNVLENLFGKQERGGELNEGKRHSLKESKIGKFPASSKILLEKLTENIPLLENDDVVYKATGSEFEQGKKKLSAQVYEYFEGLGGVVHRDNFGDVIIDDKGVDSSIAHGMGRAKAIAFASVPAVIEKGRQIDFQEKWKGRNYDSYVFAAPIQIGEGKAYTAVVVTKSEKDNRYYLHEVTDEKGNIILIKKDDVSFKSKSETNNSPLGETPSSNPTIPQSKTDVNSYSMQDGEKNSLKGKGDLVKDYEKLKSGQISSQEYEQLLERYGAISPGENPYREARVPKKTADGRKVSQTVRTILEAKATPDEAIPSIEKMVTDGDFSYDTYTDKKAISDANATIEKKGFATALTDWASDIEKGNVSKESTALGWALYNNAANSGDIKTAMTVLNKMVQHQRSAAQALQATRILKKLSPETQLYGVQKSVSALQEELVNKYGDKAPDLKVNEALAEKFLKAETQEERDAIAQEIYKDIGSQMPSRFIDKWNAWRYLAMLGNARTHIRNIVGNAAFAPVVITKDLTATAIESVVSRVSGKKTVRGKAIITGNKSDRALLKAAWSDYGNVAEMISNGGKYNDSAMANRQIEEGRQIFKLKPLEWARKKNSQLLEAEDMWFSKPHYAYALAQYCKANNITAEQIERGRAIAPAREYAIKRQALGRDNK